MAKTEFQLRDIGKILEKSNNSFQDPPLISAPHTTIKNLDGSDRQLSDPSKTLRPSIGRERIQKFDLQEVNDEKGSNGELVYKISDDRVRFVGTWSTDTVPTGTSINSVTVDDYMEITFYGTGLNLSFFHDNNVRDLRASVDGGAEGSNIYLVGDSGLWQRGYRANTIFPVVKDLSLGNHTVKIRIASAAANNHFIYGFEVLNQQSDIHVSEGSVLSNGRKYTQTSTTTTPMDSGFDGNPTLNGKGGRVLLYKLPSDDTVYKAIQQTDATQNTFLTGVDHSNEEKIRTLYPRDYGHNRADDFTTLSTESNRAYTLDNGTDTLFANQGRFSQDVSDGKQYLSTGNVNSAFTTITFVGTGLDIELADVSAAYTGNHTVTLDGTDLVTLGPRATTWGDQGIQNFKVASGLPYGTHTLRIFGQSSGTIREGFRNFKVYGPKKPSIPEGAEVIGEYYLLADFDESGATSETQSSENVVQGAIWKSALREVLYTGTWSTAAFGITKDKTGFQPFTTTNGDYFEYTFFGDAITIELDGTSANNTITVEIDSVLDATGIPGTTNITNDGGGTYSQSTPDTGVNILTFKNLTYDQHTIRVTKTAAAGTLELLGLHEGTKIHYPNTNIGSLHLGNDVPVLKESEESSVNLGEAKAWLHFNFEDNSIESSYNISSVIDITSGELFIFFERPFKNSRYVMAGSSEDGFVRLNNPPVGGATSDEIEMQPGHCQIQSINNAGGVTNTSHTMMVWFGELADEGDQ